MRTYNLLAIDDEDYAVRLINRYCRYRQDIKCHGASTSSEALEWAKSNYFDIALVLSLAKSSRKSIPALFLL